ncbi:MAG: TRAP transporter small permease [Rhodobacteraceae bacterium]|nr:TRAP transporter small permease [Paracoccaceae bacterium]
MAILDRLYRLGGRIAGLLIILICVLISAQIILNTAGRVAPGLLPSTIPSYANFAGYMLASATFLALADTLRSGGHIRVSLLTNQFSQRGQVAAEALVLAIGLAFTAFATWWLGHLVMESRQFGDVSSGIVRIPLWIPQLVMTVGMALLTVAILHTLVDLARRREPVLPSAGDV